MKVGPARREVVKFQRLRILTAAIAVAGEHGYAGTSVTRITARAGVSRETFHELYPDAEACFAEAYIHTVQRIFASALPAYDAQEHWADRVRAGLAELLTLLDREPNVARAVIMEVFAAGPRALTARANALEQLRGLLRPPGAEGPAADLPAIAEEMLTGSVADILRSRLYSTPPEPLLGLLGPIMSVIAGSYLGSEAAARELRRPAARGRTSRASEAFRPDGARELLQAHGVRPGHRMMIVVELVSEQPGLSSREIARRAGELDEGQVSRLLRRLSEAGVVEDVSGVGPGRRRAWRVMAAACAGGLGEKT
jgi:AcrR family transcriptional regulator